MPILNPHLPVCLSESVSARVLHLNPLLLGVPPVNPVLRSVPLQIHLSWCALSEYIFAHVPHLNAPSYVRPTL